MTRDRLAARLCGFVVAVRLYPCCGNTGAFWKIKDFDGTTCETSGSNDQCVQSPNYPGPYGTNNRCFIKVDSDEWAGHEINVVEFSTEGCCDFLYVDSVNYNGFVGPDAVVPTSSIIWTADGDVSRSGWKLCAIPIGSGQTPASSPGDSASSNSEEEDPDSSSGGVVMVIVLVIGGALFCIGLGCVLGVFNLRKRGRSQKEAEDRTPKAGAGYQPGMPMAMPMPMPMPLPMVEAAPIAAAATAEQPAVAPRKISKEAARKEESFPKEEEDAGPVSAVPSTVTASVTDKKHDEQIKPSRSGVLVTVPEADAKPPPWWTCQDVEASFQEIQAASSSEVAAIQNMFDSTFKAVKTRDRKDGSAMPKKLRVVSVQRIENSELWQKYTTGREYLAAKRSHKCTQAKTYGGDLLTLNVLPSTLKRSLHPRVNEFYLFHGTSAEASVNIAKTGFKLNFSGSNAGTMYGYGSYFAECSSKSDEYAQEGKDGLSTILLCRVVLGELLHMTTGGEKTYGMIKSAIESDAYDSVLGDREASVGTYREYVVYGEDQIYPEFIVHYAKE